MTVSHSQSTKVVPSDFSSQSQFSFLLFYVDEGWNLKDHARWEQLFGELSWPVIYQSEIYRSHHASKRCTAKRLCSLATTKFFSGKITSKARKDKAQVVSAERIQIMQVWCIYSEGSIILWFLQYLAITLITWLEFFFVTILSLLMSFLLFNVRWHGPIYFWWMALN